MDQFSQVYSELYDYIFSYIFVRVKGREVAEDITSKTFLTAFEIKAHYDPKKGSWRQWMTGIAKNCLLNHWRSFKIELSLEEIEQTEKHIESYQTSKEQFDHQLQFQKIMDVVSDEVRILLILRYVDDLSYEDIAEITNKTSAAVRKAFSRLHKSLKVDLS